MMLSSKVASSSVFGARRSQLVPKATRSVQVHAALNRPVWFPGNEPPAHLDGSLAGDYGFDPLYLCQDETARRWFVQAELINARFAMLGVAGILFQAIGTQLGSGAPQWYDAGKVADDQSPIPFGTLLIVELILFHFVEVKRFYDFRKPGSQGDGSFFGITDDLKGKENGYPGGKFFDPLGFSRGSEAQYKDYKQKEIKNGRLAMLAFLGFISQYQATGKGPVENLVDHLNDPYHVTFATNGVSLPFLGGW